jgi:N-acylneuraminate cytidylyltransferase
MSVWEAQDDHPMRALQIGEDGLLETYGKEEREAHTNRQSYPKAYFYDQGVWTFRKNCVKERSGPMPWWWMGKRCKPIIRPWVTGRDIHGPLDIEISEYWVRMKK